MTTSQRSPDLPFFGGTEDYLADPLGFLCDGHRRYGEIFGSHIDGSPTMIFGAPNGTRAFFHAERSHFVISNPPAVHQLFGRAIFNLGAAEHAEARRFLVPALVGGALASYVPAIVGVSGAHVSKWADGDVPDLYAAVRGLTFDVCAQVLLGSGDGSVPGLAPAFERFVSGTRVMPFAKRAKRSALAARSWLVDLLRDLAVSRQLDCVPSVLGSLMESLRRDHQDISPEEVPDHLLSLLVAARETTSSLVTWLLVELARLDSGSMRHALCAESVEVLVDPDLLLRRGSIPVLRALLTEGERLHSPNAMAFRAVVQECVLCGHTVPEGWRAAYSPSANHLRPELFDRPLRFLPERFLAGGAERALSSLLLTFGAGPHACPGRQLAEVVALATVAQVFSHHRLDIGRAPSAAEVRHFPVKAPVVSIPAAVRVGAP
jgi:cytochrome P450